MGFFDELGSMIGDVTSISDELKQTATDAVENFTQSTEDLASTKDELLNNLEDITHSNTDKTL